MSENAYLVGFSKVAEQYGINPDDLIVFSYLEKQGSNWFTEQCQKGKDFVKGLTNASEFGKNIEKYTGDGTFLGNVSSFFKNLSPDTRRALLTSLIVGVPTFMFANGTVGERLAKALGYGALGGAGMYGLSRYGLYDSAQDYFTSVFKDKNEPTNKGPSTKDTVPNRNEYGSVYTSSKDRQ